ncbi:MAG: hypothetical protein EXS31_04015 [Pedosphaera sp.]|nr:hypothetical protein [Pedosphaera sp.]
MKQVFAVLIAATVASASVYHVSAGDREWAVAGKVLTGVVAASVISRAFEPVPVYRAPVVYAAPARVVVYSSPPISIVQPAPVVIYQQPMYVQPAPVYVVPRTVYMAPPLVSFRLGFGHHHHGHHGYCR